MKQDKETKEEDKKDKKKKRKHVVVRGDPTVEIFE